MSEIFQRLSCKFLEGYDLIGLIIRSMVFMNYDLV